MDIVILEVTDIRKNLKINEVNKTAKKKKDKNCKRRQLQRKKDQEKIRKLKKFHYTCKINI